MYKIESYYKKLISLFLLFHCVRVSFLFAKCSYFAVGLQSCRAEISLVSWGGPLSGAWRKCAILGVQTVRHRWVHRRWKQELKNALMVCYACSPDFKGTSPGGELGKYRNLILKGTQSIWKILIIPVSHTDLYSVYFLRIGQQDHNQDKFSSWYSCNHHTVVSDHVHFLDGSAGVWGKQGYPRGHGGLWEGGPHHLGNTHRDKSS